MTPLEQAKECFGTCFDDMLAFGMEQGYVYSGPDCFAMAMEHNKQSLMEPNLNKPVDKLDCWLVMYVSGELNRLMELLSKLPEKEWIVFERDDEDTRHDEGHQYRCYNMKRLAEKIDGKT